MNAKEAAAMSKRNKEQRPQREWVMREIERSAKKGHNVYCVNSIEWVLFEDDIEWLQTLGYAVTLTSVGIDFSCGVVIRW